MILVIAQRYVDKTPSRNFGKYVVEALCFVFEQEAWSLCSLFYDPEAGQSVLTPFLKWERGQYSCAPALTGRARDIIAHWAVEEAGSAVSVDQYLNKLEELNNQITDNLRGYFNGAT